MSILARSLKNYNQQKKDKPSQHAIIYIAKLKEKEIIKKYYSKIMFLS